MKKINKYLILILLLVITFNLFNLAVAEAATDSDYLKWNSANSYVVSNELDDAPLTIEAKIKLPAGYTSRGGVIVSNYGDSKSKGYIIFEIYTNGNPSITLIDLNGVKTGGVYKKVNVATGDWVDLSFVLEGNNHHCYVDGELIETKTFDSQYEYYIPLTRLAVGGDRTSSNSQYFKGEIAKLGVYSDVRTADEIKNDYLSETLDQDNLMFGYDFAGLSSTDVVEDISKNDNDLRKQYHEVSDSVVPSADEYDYSMAVIGDTQTVNNHRPEHIKTIYDFVVNNVESMKIQHVAGMGDITDASYDREYTNAIEQFKRLDGLVSYSLVRGNHDSVATFEKYLGVESTYCGYSSQYKEYYKNSTNTVHEFSAGNLDYLVLVLDLGAADDVLEWASDVVEAHPYHNVIISTHGYLDRNGFLLRPSSPGSTVNHGGYNEGTDLWEKFVSQHENIVLVLCGHEPADEVKVLKTKGVHGNIVTQVLINTQYVDRDDINAGGDGYGIVSMLYFSNGGQTVDFRYYSTIKDYYFKTYNQFSMNLNIIKRKLDVVKDGILNLPQKENISLSDEESILELNNLYLSLSGEEKNMVDTAKLVEALEQIDICKAQSFDEIVLGLPEEITLEDKDILFTLKEMYENSSDIFKQEAKQIELYKEKIESLMIIFNKINAPIINKEILYLSYPLALDDREKVLDLRKQYNELDEESKKNVIYIEKLEEAEAIINILLEQYEKALIVDEMIANLPDKIDLNCEEEVKSVRAEYAKLDPIAKDYVTRIDILESAEDSIADAYSKKRSKDLNEMILSLPDDISLADKEIIVNIRNRYDLLDEEGKKYVSEIFLLETFEARIRILEELKVKVDVINAKVESLPSNISPDDRELVESLLEEYNNLTADEKQLFTQIDKLNSALDSLENKTDDKGCAGSAISSIFGLIFLLGAVVILQKQKKLRKDNGL